MGNLGKPILLSELNIHGVAKSAAQEGGKVEIWTRLAMTSDEAMFHRIAQNLSNTMEHAASQEGKGVALSSANSVLAILHEDNSAELWVDAAAIQLNVLLKRDAKAGEAIFERDIADVTGMDFPLVQIGDADRVICWFREGWRFGLLFDFNPEKQFDRQSMRAALGRLHRTMRYRHLYDALSNQPLFERLVTAGWFPFAEIITSEFDGLLRECEAGFELAQTEGNLVSSFDRERLERIFSRWMLRPHFAGKEELLRAAVEGFLANQPITTIKIALTEIEGILADAYRVAHGHGAKLKTLLSFAVQSAEGKTGAPDTLMFPAAFAEYLRAYTFGDFDPDGPPPKASSRHAVGHGAAETQSYTMVRALQSLLTLDQLAFYT